MPELELVVSYDVESGARYEDLDGTVFARPPRLWDVSFMLDGDRPFYLIDCKDSSAKDSQVTSKDEIEQRVPPPVPGSPHTSMPA